MMRAIIKTAPTKAEPRNLLSLGALVRGSLDRSNQNVAGVLVLNAQSLRDPTCALRTPFLGQLTDRWTLDPVVRGQDGLRVGHIIGGLIAVGIGLFDRSDLSDRVLIGLRHGSDLSLLVCLDSFLTYPYIIV
jgi:hypothetical protein